MFLVWVDCFSVFPHLLPFFPPVSSWVCRGWCVDAEQWVCEQGHCRCPGEPPAPAAWEQPPAPQGKPASIQEEELTEPRNSSSEGVFWVRGLCVILLWDQGFTWELWDRGMPLLGMGAAELSQISARAEPGPAWSQGALLQGEQQESSYRGGWNRPEAELMVHCKEIRGLQSLKSLVRCTETWMFLSGGISAPSSFNSCFNLSLLCLAQSLAVD